MVANPSVKNEIKSHSCRTTWWTARVNVPISEANLVAMKKIPDKINDLPVLNDFRKKKPTLFTFWYKKTFKIQFILYKELGSKAYRKFLSEFIKNQKKYKTFKSILQLLKKIKNKNWENILSGWITKGKYYKYNWKDFKNKTIKNSLKIK